MATIFFVSVPTKRLSASITSASSTIQLNNILGWDGNALSSADFGTKLYCVLRNDANTLMEIMELDPSTIASASITVLRRGLKHTGEDLTTETSANKLSWVKNETLCELGTDVPQLLAHTVRIVGDQTIAGVKTFSSTPVLPLAAPTANTEAANKAYVDSVGTGAATYDQNIISGTAGETLAAGNAIYFKTSDQRWWKTAAATASTVVGVKLGFAQGAATAGVTVNVLIAGQEKNLSGLTAGSSYFFSDTSGAIATSAGTTRVFAGIALSTTRFLIMANDHLQETAGNDGTPSSTNKFLTQSGYQKGAEIYAADSVGTDAYAITLSPAITSYTAGAHYFFKAGTANTAAATLAINGLTAKDIRKKFNAALITGDILAGQIVEVAYDGTNDWFQMLSPEGTTVTTSLSNDFGDGNDGAVTIGSDTSLSRDMYYSSLTVSGGFTLTTAGFAIYCNGTTNVLGTISTIGGVGANGTNAVGTTAGSGGAGGAATASGRLTGSKAGTGGGAGGTGRGASAGSGNAGTVGTAGTAGVAVSLGAAGKAGVSGGAGGAGGNAGGAGGAGGAAGAAGAVALTRPVLSPMLATGYELQFAGTVAAYAPGGGTAGSGGGGSGGLSGNTDNSGGGGGGAGGGGGGGVMLLRTKTLAGNGTITAAGGVGGNGGNGAAGSGSTDQAGGGGGGGAGSGGSGGIIILSYNSSTFSGTLSVAGGAAGSVGTGGAAGGGGGSPGVSGTAGNAGNAGVAYQIQL